MKTMPCRQCGHKVPVDRRCIYCGAPPHSGPAGRRSASSAGSGAFLREEVESEGLHDLPEGLRLQAEEKLRQGAGEVVLEERTVVENGPAVPEDRGEAALPLHRMIDALGKMKAALGSGALEQGFYRHVAKGMIFDYVDSLPRGEKVRFVARDLEESDLAPYADDDMKKELMAYALAEAGRQGGEKGGGT